MSDLETKLAEARKNHIYNNQTHANIHVMAVDRIAAIAREVVAEKDAALAGCDEHGIIGAYLEALEDARQLRATLTEKDAEIARIRTGHVCDNRCAHTMSLCDRCNTYVGSRHPRMECAEIALLRAEIARLRSAGAS